MFRVHYSDFTELQLEPSPSYHVLAPVDVYLSEGDRTFMYECLSCLWNALVVTTQ